MIFCSKAMASKNSDLVKFGEMDGVSKRFKNTDGLPYKILTSAPLLIISISITFKPLTCKRKDCQRDPTLSDFVDNLASVLQTSKIRKCSRCFHMYVILLRKWEFAQSLHKCCLQIKA